MYDLIIGKQTLHSRGVVLDFNEKTIHIDTILLPMRSITNLQLKPSTTRALRHDTHDTFLAQEPVSTVVEILDAKYEKADLQAIVRENCSHLHSDREKLLSMLLKFELLFDGMLGERNLPPVSFELKEGMKPYHGRPYPIPHKHKAVLMKEIKQLCNIGVLEWQPSLQWASPTFIIPNKDSTVSIISDFRELSKCIVRKPYPTPKISAMVQELEGFTMQQPLILTWAATPSGLTQQHPRCILSSSLGKSTLVRDYPWVLEAKQTYFQAQMMDLMASLEYVQAYFVDLLNIARGTLDVSPLKNRGCACQTA
jgi:hypothetical protein